MKKPKTKLEEGAHNSYANKKRWKEGREEGRSQEGRSQEGHQESRKEEITRTSRLQHEPSTGAHKHLRPKGPCERNDETFKRSSSFLFAFRDIGPACSQSHWSNPRFHRTPATSHACAQRLTRRSTSSVSPASAWMIARCVARVSTTGRK